MKALLKYVRINIYEICAFTIIVLALVLRILLIALGWPMTNSDESTMGLMALHIAYRGELPIFFYGQGYMGTLQAYLAAALFHFLGPSFFTLRLGLIFLFVLFLVSMYLLTRLLYSKSLALFTLLLLSLGSQNILYQELFAIGGYQETLLFGSLILLLATWLALTSNQQAMTPMRRSKQRLLLYGSFGLVVGIALWSDLLVLPIVIMATLLLAVFCRHELRWVALIWLLMGLLVGIFPMIFYNLTVPFQQGTFAYMGNLLRGHGNTSLLLRLGQGIIGTIMVSLPSATGGDLLCPVSKAYTGPIAEHASAPTIQCAVVHGVWGVGFIVLLLLAIFLAVHRYRQYREALHSAFQGNRRGRLIVPTADVSAKMERHSGADLSHAERQADIRHFARLMVLSSGALTLLIYALSYQAVAAPISSARYLIVLLIAFPALIAPLWNAARSSASLAKGIRSLSIAILLFITVTFFVGTVSTFADVSGAQASEQRQEALIDNLLHIGASHIYSDYWTCDRLIFASNEHIICSVVGNYLQPGLDRYLPYRSIVRVDPHSAYVFPIGSRQATAFAQKVALSSARYRRFVFDDYIIYQPSTWSTVEQLSHSGVRPR